MELFWHVLTTNFATDRSEVAGLCTDLSEGLMLRAEAEQPRPRSNDAEPSATEVSSLDCLGLQESEWIENPNDCPNVSNCIQEERQ